MKKTNIISYLLVLSILLKLGSFAFGYESGNNVPSKHSGLLGKSYTLVGAGTTLYSNIDTGAQNFYLGKNIPLTETIDFTVSGQNSSISYDGIDAQVMHLGISGTYHHSPGNWVDPFISAGASHASLNIGFGGWSATSTTTFYNISAGSQFILGRDSAILAMTWSKQEGYDTDTEIKGLYDKKIFDKFSLGFEVSLIPEATVSATNYAIAAKFFD